MLSGDDDEIEHTNLTLNADSNSSDNNNTKVTDSIEEKHDQDTTIADQDDNSSPMANIIPIHNLQNGWNVLSSIFSTGMDKIKEKTVEAYNCESAQNIRQATTNGLNQAVEVIMPAVETTKSSISAAVDYTKERASFVAANSEPAMRAVGDKIAESATISWKHVVSVVEFANESVSKLASAGLPQVPQTDVSGETHSEIVANSSSNENPKPEEEQKSYDDTGNQPMVV